MPRKRASDENDPEPSTSKRRRQNMEVATLSQNNSINSKNQIWDCQDWSRSGKVVRMRLINFMCHEHLQVEFNPRVNLLIGRNGSGKSAILAALVVGLGSRTSATNRSTNLKNLIKSGENQATIEIELANTGDDAYDHDKFGDKIIVKRKLLASGSSQYEIKDQKGCTLSKSRDDLMKILMFHNIQTDNPVFVLNQDAARSFLKDLDPHKNYKLFLKATQLELIMEKLNDCARLYKEFKSKLAITEKVLKVSEEEVRQLQIKYERLKSVEDMKVNLAAFKCQSLWLKVTQQEEKIRKLRDEISLKEQQKSEIQSRLDGNSDGSLQYCLSDLQKKVEEANAVLEKENRILVNLKEKYKVQSNTYQTEGLHQSKLMEKIKHIKDQIDIIETEMNQRTESSATRISRMRKEVEEKRARLDQKRAEVEAMMNTLNQELRLNEQNKERQTEEYETTNAQKVQLKITISKIEHELSRIVSSNNDRTEIFGNYMRSLLTLIEREYKAGKFKALPKGPLGRHLEVSDKKWRGVVEQLLGRFLTAFLVDNGQDRIVLDIILKTNFPNANHMIITSSFRGKLYDVQSGCVPKIENTYLLMDLIKCPDPDIVNCLIDQVQIETILIVEDFRVAEYLTSDENNVPPNLQKVLLTDPLMEYYPSPLYRAYSLQPRPPRYIQVNMDERRIALEEEMHHSKELIHQIERKIQTIRVTLGNFAEHQKQKQALLRKYESTLNQVKIDLEQQDNYDFPSEGEDAALQNEHDKLLNNMKDLQAKLKDTEQRSMELKQLVLDRHNEVQKQQEKISRFEADANDLSEELNTKQDEATRKQSSLRAYNEKLKVLHASLEEMQTEIEEEEQQLLLLEQQARQSGERISTDKSSQELNNLIKSLEVKVREICSTNDNIDEVEALLNNREMKMKKESRCINSIMDTLDLMRKSRKQRFKSLKCLHEHMAIRVSHMFKNVLKLRKFDGELDIDYNNKTLDMNIVPRDKHIEDAVSSTKALSGGERSFSTVALLLSLWSCIDHPFYFLDEYDVFTDEFNRKVITRLLLSEAMKKSHRQYTFLSPQDMSFVEASNTIKIHRLADPRSPQK